MTAEQLRESSCPYALEQVTCIYDYFLVGWAIFLRENGEHVGWCFMQSGAALKWEAK